tara:strand:+ start:2090 stop:3466 length:1377 start_codon:yes stop_codon:yes gene_type:complete
MKIIILGAGQVGGTLAENMVVEEHHELTIVDHDAATLRDLQSRLDVRTVFGHCSQPEVLEQAGAEDADMLIAVTNSDEVNMVACQIAYTLFHTPTKIARLRSQDYMGREVLFDPQAFPIDVRISPELLVTDNIVRLLGYPGALQVMDFAGGRVRLVSVKAYYGGPLVGHALSALREHMPNIDSRVAAIFRQGKAIIPEGNTLIEPDDEVFFIAAKEHIRRVMAELRRLENPYRRIMIAGGGNIGMALAKRLEDKYQVKLFEHNAERARYISGELDNTLVLLGDASNKELLIHENVDETDVFIAVTNDDEANIMSAMLAKRLGVRKTLVLISRSAYVDLVQGGDIDIAISPQQITTSSLLSYVRRGDVVNAYSLRRGDAEAIEAIAHGDRTNSKVVGRTVGELKLPPGCSVGAIVRGEETLIAHHDTVIESNDHVILFLTDRKYIRQVERLFQVGITFF